MKVRFLGDPTDPDKNGNPGGDEENVAYGITFKRGKVVDVPDDHPFAHKFLNHQHFEVVGNEDKAKEKVVKAREEAKDEPLPDHGFGQSGPKGA